MSWPEPRRVAWYWRAGLFRWVAVLDDGRHMAECSAWRRGRLYGRCQRPGAYGLTPFVRVEDDPRASGLRTSPSVDASVRHFREYGVWNADA